MQLNQYKLPVNGLNVSIQTTFDSEALSGETSATAQAHKGIKPKEINASFTVPFTEAETITAFYTVAEAVDTNGDLVVYDITERTANSANVRQVIFCGRIDQRQVDNLEAWIISFRLKEHLSIAEKIEQRQTPTPAQPVVTQAQPVPGAPAPTGPEVMPPLTGFEKILQKIDEALA